MLKTCFGMTANICIWYRQHWAEILCLRLRIALDPPAGDEFSEKYF